MYRPLGEGRESARYRQGPLYSFRPHRPKKDTSLAALVASREDCAGNKAAIAGVVVHDVDPVVPVFGARFNRSVTAQLALVVLPLAFTIQMGKVHHPPGANVGNQQQRRSRPRSHY